MTDQGRQSSRDETLRAQVRDRYRSVALHGGCCGSGPGGTCCAASADGRVATALRIGYHAEDLEGLPKGANLGLGCGHPTALAALRPGEVVLDLGSGGGIDCFLAARKVGPRGRVIGVDMTAEMLAKARANARRAGYRNVEFRLGEIEHLPVADGSVDVVLSNCVINLAPDKGAVYREAFRALRPGGRIAVADVVATRPIPRRKRQDPSLWSSCSSGALQVRTLKSLLRRMGFEQVAVDLGSVEKAPATWTGQASLGVVPANIRGTKPLR